MLGVHNWGDADKMVTLCTQERGRIRAAAFGCRRARSPLAAGMQMFQHIDCELTEGQKVDTIRQCSILRRYRRLSENLDAMAYGSFIAELVSELMPEHVPETAVFALLQEIFATFEYRNARVTALIAAYQLMEYSGMQLSYGHCVHCGKELTGDARFSISDGGALCEDCYAEKTLPYSEALRQFILSLRTFDWKQETELQVKKQELLQAEQLLLHYLRTLFGKPLRSLEFLGQMG